MPWQPTDTVPDGLRWKPDRGVRKRAVVLVSTPGSFYRLVRDLRTGEVRYFKKPGADAPKSPAELIDAEPPKPKQVRYHVGKHAWFILHGRWYLVKIAGRDDRHITVESVTGLDAERQSPWPHQGAFTFSPNSTWFKRLRPLKARYR